MPKGYTSVLPTVEPLQRSGIDLDQVALLNEVLEKRQEELAEARMQLENVRAKIISERVQWTSQKDEEAAALRDRAAHLEEAYRQKLHQVDEDIRQTSLSLASQRDLWPMPRCV